MGRGPCPDTRTTVPNRTPRRADRGSAQAGLRPHGRDARRSRRRPCPSAAAGQRPGAAQRSAGGSLHAVRACRWRLPPCLLPPRRGSTDPGPTGTRRRCRRGGAAGRERKQIFGLSSGSVSEVRGRSDIGGCLSEDCSDPRCRRVAHRSLVPWRSRQQARLGLEMYHPHQNAGCWRTDAKGLRRKGDSGADCHASPWAFLACGV